MVIHIVQLDIITTIRQLRRDIITITTDRRRLRVIMGHRITIMGHLIMGHLIMGHLTSIVHLLTEDTDKKYNEI